MSHQAIWHFDQITDHFATVSLYLSEFSTSQNNEYRSVPFWKKKKVQHKKVLTQDKWTKEWLLSNLPLHLFIGGLLLDSLLNTSLSLGGLCWLCQPTVIFPLGKQMNKSLPFILTVYNLIIRTLSNTMCWTNYGLSVKSAPLAYFVCVLSYEYGWHFLMFFLTLKKKNILWHVNII